MKFKSVLPWAFIVTLSVNAQDPTAQLYGSKVSSDELREYLSIIASDALEGRETGTRGQKMAAAFIANHFQELGLTGPVNGSYYQPVELYSSAPSAAYLIAGKSKFDNYAEVVYIGSADSQGEVTLPVVFVGNATESDFNQVDVKDKAVFFFAKETRITKSKKVALAREKGAKMILISNTDTQSDFKELAGQIRNFVSEGKLSLEKPKESQDAGIFLLSAAVVEKVMGTTMDKLKKTAAEDPSKNALMKVKHATIQYKTTSPLKIIKTENVLGYLEGSDKKDEVIVITAHYDHIGKDKNGKGDLINNGADDDGSGTVAVMELARVFAYAKKEGKGPRRSILFMTVTGEEKGLLGSDYYTRNPIFPLASTIVNLNIDMVGRRDPQHQDSAPYVYVIGSDKLSDDLHAVSESVNKANGNIIFDYTYNDPKHPDKFYYRSDHWNFAKNNIPIIFYFNGVHEDYHKPSDQVEKIEFDLLTKRTQCVFYTAWEIANREQRIKVDQDKMLK